MPGSTFSVSMNQRHFMHFNMAVSRPGTLKIKDRACPENCSKMTIQLVAQTQTDKRAPVVGSQPKVIGDRQIAFPSECCLRLLARAGLGMCRSAKTSDRAQCFCMV